MRLNSAAPKGVDITAKDVHALSLSQVGCYAKKISQRLLTSLQIRRLLHRFNTIINRILPTRLQGLLCQIETIQIENAKATGLMTSLPGICGLLHNDIAYVGRGLMTPLPGVTSLPKIWASAVDAWG